MRSLAVSSALLLAAAGAASGAQWKETRYYTDSTCASNYGFQNDNMARRILASYWRVDSCEPADCALVGQFTYSKTSCSTSPPSPALGSGVGTLEVFANSDTTCQSAAQNTFTIPTNGVCKNNTDTSTRTSCNTENYSELYEFEYDGSACGGEPTHITHLKYNTLCVSEAKAKWDFTMCSGAVATGAMRAGFGLAVMMAAAIAAIAL